MADDSKQKPKIEVAPASEKPKAPAEPRSAIGPTPLLASSLIKEAARRAVDDIVQPRFTVRSFQPLSEIHFRNLGSLSDDDVSTLLSSIAAPHDEVNKLRAEIDDLLRTATEQAKALAAAKAGSEDYKQTIAALNSTVDRLREKEKLGFLLERVRPEAQDHLRASESFRRQFLDANACNAFVMAVDIRRSTELMLNARSAAQFADFITALTHELRAIVLDAFGVFDKFTEDGILAFFPDFYSGDDASYRVIDAADRCHAAFQRHYHSSRKPFKTVLTDVGLGIGIDYGPVRLVQVAGGLTVVGEPVVYACRLSAAPPTVTLLNQPAYEEISTRFGGFCFAEEKQHEIKHEGRMLAYEVRLNGRRPDLTPPEWPTDATQNSASQSQIFRN